MSRLPTLALIAVFAMAAALNVTAAKPAGGDTAAGTAFLPNPVADLQDQSLTDRKDADYAALAPAYRRVTLTNLDGSGYLRGDWAVIISETGNPAFSPAGTFDYHRNQDEFEQVMAYYWITEAQNYIQRLGFGAGGLFPGVNDEPQRVRINQWGADNSFFTDKKDELRFGKGGVDDAEDAEVILHEYGHAMQDAQQSPFGFGFSIEARSIGEGFADYWAVTVSSLVAPTADPACVADWDSVSYTASAPHCLRRVDTNLHYPEDLNGRVHHDGMIWSRALWDIRKAIGATQADTVILNAHFGMPDPTMPQLAVRTVEKARQIYGNGVANKVNAAFVARGIL
jgi:zinc metalloprotease ZmpB